MKYISMAAATLMLILMAVSGVKKDLELNNVHEMKIRTKKMLYMCRKTREIYKDLRLENVSCKKQLAILRFHKCKN